MQGDGTLTVVEFDGVGVGVGPVLGANEAEDEDELAPDKGDGAAFAGGAEHDP